MRKVERIKKKADKAQVKADKAVNKIKKTSAANKNEKRNKIKKTLQESNFNMCNIFFKDDDDNEKSKWIPCEECDNWVCSNCLPPLFYSSDDYLCRHCYKLN
jgi:hypothetical protein